MHSQAALGHILRDHGITPVIATKLALRASARAALAPPALRHPCLRLLALPVGGWPRRETAYPPVSDATLALCRLQSQHRPHGNSEVPSYPPNTFTAPDDRQSAPPTESCRSTPRLDRGARFRRRQRAASACKGKSHAASGRRRSRIAAREFVPHCSESCRRALQWEQWAVVRLMWKELLRARCLPAKLERAIDCMRLIAGRIARPPLGISVICERCLHRWLLSCSVAALWWSAEAIGLAAALR